MGYVGAKNAAPILIDGLRRLEYRGYDSAGVALQYANGDVEVTRAAGRLVGLEGKLREMNGHALEASVGIGHTRWATHGAPTEDNAHPHSSTDGKIVVVHNGIFENFQELRTELAGHGFMTKTQTDTECFPLMVSHLMKAGESFERAFCTAVQSMRGKYALACVHADYPGKILVARSGPPLVIGIGKDEYFIASDVAPLLPYTRDTVYLEDGDMAELTRDGLRVLGIDGQPVDREVQHIDWDANASELGTSPHFMHKEIFEQPEALSRTVEAHLSGDQIRLGDATTAVLSQTDRVSILACGTSWHAALVGKFLIEQLARVQVDVDYASEYRYRDPIVSPTTLAIAITQSGETADTVAALAEAKSRGARTLAITNTHGSQATRLAEASLITRAGPEIGVASTKAFTTQLGILALLALEMGRLNGNLSPEVHAELVQQLRELPAKLERLRSVESQIEVIARRWFEANSALYLGRGPLYPVALEGALKLKEISYIHAQGYPAGEMKHGPIALIDDKMPVLALLADDGHRDRVLSNLQEAAARGAPIIAIVPEGDTSLDTLAREVIYIPHVHPSLAPILYTVPLQLFAYHVAVMRGCDVDRPRNLAKSVTVE
ncbi:MAG TPA: glutamine--fructose-6-phosphate transaminase (isomerizing) [Polyangiaceae bacterium]|jgi:glucosamine--fructose-6-phosphate aminotransferase (isomerizing)|nr:glutamine--fructose-6-phosphate transaminase (isomerizing) [Polyangiaceae bacterium]